ncbi:DUF5711 family protein [Paenibacillus hexagrammi]|uniref:PQQ-binding-like beta-propeller repeat protein n=1 Tax=Paenibacillus hexagrammi TaxID=2908839 RepID=A0ABY3SC39_9BACL|nr:stalk domain-containing protein [Paenibacillus sp. YPD9-1]UJF31508.1 PQQ-binding-like beta-propeller repeat protein [Paenibacillus sp. YPD9-1]
MKKFLLGLSGLIILSSMPTTMAFANTDVPDPIVLPLKDDSGHNWSLLNENNMYRLKWSYTSDSQYDHFDARKVNEHTIIIHSFNEVFAVDENGHVLWKQDGSSHELETSVDGNLFTATDDFAFLDPEAKTSKATITRFNNNGTILNQYKDIPLAIVRPGSTFTAARFYTIDWKGNLIALLENGLTMLRQDGSVKWQFKELKVNDVSYSMSQVKALLSDSQGHLLVASDKQLFCLNDDGKVIWNIPYQNSKTQIKINKDYLVIGENIYKVSSTGITEVTDPEVTVELSGRASDHHGGYYQVDENTSTLMDKSFQANTTLWSYKLSDPEQSAGYNMAGNFDQNLVADDEGNVYVSTNGGTIHSLDNQGNPRFTLQITNKIIGYSQIIPLNPNNIVITNNRNVLCLERVDNQQSDISLWLNGKEQFMKKKLFMKDGRVMISLREIFEMLGAEVTWKAENEQILAKRNGKQIAFQIGSNDAYVDDTAIVLDAAPVLIDEVTYVPLRYVTEALGSNVEWDATNKVVKIIDSESNDPK